MIFRLSPLALILGLLSSSLFDRAVASELDYDEYPAVPATTVTPLLLREMPLNLRFQRRQANSTCPTGTTSCGSNCCAGNTNCWNDDSCAPLGQCPAGAPVQCRFEDDAVADPNGMNSNQFYCCPSGYFCARTGEPNNCIISQTTTSGLETVTIAIKTIITVSPEVMATPTGSTANPTSSAPTSDAQLVANPTGTTSSTSSTSPTMSATTAPKKKLPVGPIVGGVVGGVVVVVAIAVALFCIQRRTKPTEVEPKFNPKTATISSFGSPRPGHGAEGNGAPSPNPYINRQFNYAGYASSALGSPRSPGFQISHTPLGSPRSPGFPIGNTPLASPTFPPGSSPLASPPLGGLQQAQGSTHSLSLGQYPPPAWYAPPAQGSAEAPRNSMPPYNPATFAQQQPQQPGTPGRSTPIQGAPEARTSLGGIAPYNPATFAQKQPGTPGRSTPVQGTGEPTVGGIAPYNPANFAQQQQASLPGRSTPTQGAVMELPGGAIPGPPPFPPPDAPALRPEGRAPSYHETEAAPNGSAPDIPELDSTELDQGIPELESTELDPPPRPFYALPEQYRGSQELA